MRATRFRRAALFAERLAGTGKKVKGREIDVAPCFCTGPCASKAANHWQASAPRRAPVAPRWRRVRDSNPRRTCILNGFQDRRVQPLRQLSMSCSSPRSFRCAPLARRLAKSFFSLRPVCSWSARLALRSTRSETRQICYFFFARAGFTGVVFTSSTIFAVTSGFALR